MSSPMAPRVLNKGVDEDLTLFKDLRKRNQEKHHNSINLLLHHFPDEFDHSTQFNKIHADYGKHDYDWLKTPPATPLFPSIEMEAKVQQFCNRKEIQTLQSLSKFAGENNITDQAARTGNTKAKQWLSRSTVKLPTPISMSSTKSDANKIIMDGNSNQDRVTRLDGRGRAASPLVASKLTPKLSSSTGIGLSDKTPPNLRTERRSSSVSRGGRYSSSRGIMAEPVAVPLSIKTKAQEDNSKNNNNKILGSKMVEKIMNARKSTTMLSNFNATANGSTTKINYDSRSKQSLLIARSAAK